MKEALVVFAKAPLVRQVKTRLIGAMLPEQVTELYVCFLQDTFSIIEPIQEEREELSLALCYTPADEIETFEVADLEGCMLLPQRGQDLGERLQHCFEDLFSLGFGSIVIIGADSPTLPEEIIVEAFDRLRESDSIILGPSADGGYYLIGLNHILPKLFEKIDWGTSSVLAQTQQRATESNQSVSLLPEWNDVDTPEDLEILQQQITSGEATPKRTAKFLKKHFAKH